MADKKNKYRVLFAGGGTGGHLFPAVAVADEIKARKPEADIMFIGTKAKIEGRVVPSLGYKFKSIWIKGFSRKFTLENILFPLKLFVSVVQSLRITMKFKPAVVVGSGGYVSGPAIWAANVMGAKIVLLEQNSYPGVTTRLLERYADEVHLAFEDSKRYMRRPDILKLSGNPTRVPQREYDRAEVLMSLGLDSDKKTLLVLGGSLGAASINSAVAASVDKFRENGIQVIWQTGKNYFNRYKQNDGNGVRVFDFIEDVYANFAASDLILSRAGATTAAEITALGMPAVLVPSPNVAGNHQYFNAKSIADRGGAVLLEDNRAAAELFDTVKELLADENKLKELREKSAGLGRPDVAGEIAERVIALAEEYGL